MPFDPQFLEEIVYGDSTTRRFTQDSPVLPDVWLAYAEQPRSYQDLLLTPHKRSDAGTLSRELRRRLESARESVGGTPSQTSPPPVRISYNQSTVLAALSFPELICVALPMTKWWDGYAWCRQEADDPQRLRGSMMDNLEEDLPRKILSSRTLPAKLAKMFFSGRTERLEVSIGKTKLLLSADLLWLIRMAGAIQLLAQVQSGKEGGGEQRDGRSLVPRIQSRPEHYQRVARQGIDVLSGFHAVERESQGKESVWLITRNRRATASVFHSREAVKADAAVRVFDINCRDLTWAVLDSGIDAVHPAFRTRTPERKMDADGRQVQIDPMPDAPGHDFRKRTRVLKTYDFTLIRYLLDGSEQALDHAIMELTQRAAGNPDEALKRDLELRIQHLSNVDAEYAKEVRRQLMKGRDIDWNLLIPLLEIPHIQGLYRRPQNGHGTHVAGIMGADWRLVDNPPPDRDCDLIGLCPEIRLYDLRVLEADGGGDEFSIIAALQFVRYLNAHKDQMVVHGVNVSLSIHHEVANYACGRTPVCEECERLVDNGIVVVAAAGNEGYRGRDRRPGSQEGYRNISITDPGNTEAVITVGATHRNRPHTYGISYFSSRGPTGDGRTKPDLVAPGEKIESTFPEERIERLDGTSQASPHVSGVAALLMARHREMIGQPRRIKEILCKTATDLGRERYFQGAGMIDALRALESI